MPKEEGKQQCEAGGERKPGDIDEAGEGGGGEVDGLQL